jgi:hypothetical protein
MLQRPNWLSKVSLKSSELESNITTEIRLVGDRRSGKTAYMASLAYWPRVNSDSPVQSVNSVGDREAGQKLIDYAKNILERGLELQRTPANKNQITDVKNYGLEITLKEQFGSNPVKLTINCRDYPGEFFRDLYQKPNEPWSDDYFEDCRTTMGILLLVDGTTHLKDSDYARGLSEFFRAIKDTKEQQNRRIACVISKCELSQLWVSRNEPREMAQRLFPKTVKELENWAEGKQKTRQVDYFASSAFGSFGKDYPEPNTEILQRERGGYACIIRRPKQWQPFGLVSPIYWLATGHRHQLLDRE